VRTAIQVAGDEIAAIPHSGVFLSISYFLNYFNNIRFELYFCGHIPLA
jgi:hypothetical protein